MQVSKPEVIYKHEHGVTLEPMEDIWIDVPELYSGMVIQKMSRRGGELKNMAVWIMCFKRALINAIVFILPSRMIVTF